MLNNQNTELNSLIHRIIDSIKMNKIDYDIEYLHLEMTYDSEQAKIHNLLGIIAEIKGDRDLACSYYRASFAFDSEFSPANDNLCRITNFNYHFDPKAFYFDFNDPVQNKVSSGSNEYYLEFDRNRVGHIKKRC